MTENVHSAWAGTALTCHRAGTARFSLDRAVPGLLSQHGGTSGTARRATVPLSAVPDRARARAGPGGPVGQLYLQATKQTMPRGLSQLILIPRRKKLS